MLFSDQFNFICEKFGLFKFWLCVKQFDWVEKEWHGCLKIKICGICYFQHSFFPAHFFDNLEVFGRLYTWEIHRLYSIIAQSAPFQRKFLQKRLWLFSTANYDFPKNNHFPLHKWWYSWDFEQQANDRISTPDNIPIHSIRL